MTVQIFDYASGNIVNSKVDIDFPERFDAENPALVLSPPFVDIHTHVRLNDQEDYDSLNRAALVGGFGACVIQPNTKPPIENLEVLENHIRFSKGKEVKFLHTLSLFGDIEDLDGLENFKGNIAGWSTDGIRYTSEDLVRAFSRKKNALVFDHSQIHEIPGDFYIGTNLPNASRTYSNEAIAICRTVLTGLEFGFNKFHIQHVSTVQSLEMIEFLRRKAQITCEVTPHHVFFLPEDIRNTNQKINPPISKDKDVLIKAVRDGVITCFATDHAPHLEKGDNFEQAPFGSSHIEVAFSVYFTVFKDVELVLRNLTVNPLRVLNKTYERLDLHFPDDAVLIDTNAEYIVESRKLVSKGKNCAFEGQRLKGRILGVRRNGRWVYWNGEFLN